MTATANSTHVKPGDSLIPENRAARAILFQLLQDGYPEVARGALKEHLSDVPPAQIDVAIRTLKECRVVVIKGEKLRAGCCAIYLDKLGIVTI